MQMRAVPKELQAHLRILRKVCLWIEKRFDESMILTAIDITEHDGKVTEVSLCSKPGQNMCAFGILVTLPDADVVIDEVGVTVGTIEDKGLQSKLELYLSQRHVGEFGLYPESRQ